MARKGTRKGAMSRKGRQAKPANRRTKKSKMTGGGKIISSKPKYNPGNNMKNMFSMNVEKQVAPQTTSFSFFGGESSVSKTVNNSPLSAGGPVRQRVKAFENSYGLGGGPIKKPTRAPPAPPVAPAPPVKYRPAVAPKPDLRQLVVASH